MTTPDRLAPLCGAAVLGCAALAVYAGSRGLDHWAAWLVVLTLMWTTALGVCLLDGD